MCLQALQRGWALRNLKLMRLIAVLLAARWIRTANALAFLENDLSRAGLIIWVRSDDGTTTLTHYAPPFLHNHILLKT
jgi:hypothetical protein